MTMPSRLIVRSVRETKNEKGEFASLVATR